MSSINSVRKLQILYFSKKNKKVKNLKMVKKNGPISAFIHTNIGDQWKAFCRQKISQFN